MSESQIIINRKNIAALVTLTAQQQQKLADLDATIGQAQQAMIGLMREVRQLSDQVQAMHQDSLTNRSNRE